MLAEQAAAVGWAAYFEAAGHLPTAGSSGCKGSSSSSLESSYPGRDKNKLMHISELHCKYVKYAKYDKYDRYVQYDKYDQYETTTLVFSANGPSISILSRFVLQFIPCYFWDIGRQ